MALDSRSMSFSILMINVDGLFAYWTLHILMYPVVWHQHFHSKSIFLKWKSRSDVLEQWIWRKEVATLLVLSQSEVCVYDVT